MLTKDAAHALIKKIVGKTKYYAIVTFTDIEESTTRFANSQISQNVMVSDAKINLTLYDGKKETTCSTNDISEESIKKLVQRAEDRMPFVPNGMFNYFSIPQTSVRDAKETHVLNAFGINERVSHIKAGVSKLESGFTAAGALSADRKAIAIGDNQHSFRYGAYEMVRFNTVVTHDSGAAGSAECGSCDEIPNIAAAFSKAYSTAKKAINPVEIDTGAYTVVLSPIVLYDLLYFVTYLHNAKCIDDGESYIIGKMGAKLFGHNISIKDDVHHEGTLPFYFDMEGNTRKSVDLITNGVVKSLLYDNKTAARHQVPSTGHAFTNKGTGGEAKNIIMKGGTQTLDEIIAGTRKGIYINEFHYTNFVNPRALQVTGLTRNGTFLIEDGKITRPITTMRFTQNLIESFNQVSALSVEREKIVSSEGISFIPGARIENFNFTGKQ